MARDAAARAYLSIGEVLASLRTEFPDTTISKIRFLESIGLVEPVRTPSNYRKFTYGDLDRLRYILTAQRDRYLPLKVIRAELDALDNGSDPTTSRIGGPRLVPGGEVELSSDGVPAPAAFTRDTSRTRLTRQDLADQSGLDDDTLSALEAYSLIRPRPGTSHYDADALAVAVSVADLARFGLEPRHLRGFRTAADREVGLIQQLVAPLERQRGADARARATEVARELAAACLRLHATLVKAALPR